MTDKKSERPEEVQVLFKSCSGHPRDEELARYIESLERERDELRKTLAETDGDVIPLFRNATTAIKEKDAEIERLKGVCGNHDANARLAQERAEKAEAELAEARAMPVLASRGYCAQQGFLAFRGVDIPCAVFNEGTAYFVRVYELTQTFADWQKSREKA